MNKDIYQFQSIGEDSLYVFVSEGTQGKVHTCSSLSFQGYIDQKSVLLGKNQRNILYQRAIDSNWEQLSDKLGFWGVKAGKLEKYAPGNAYDRILVKLK